MAHDKEKILNDLKGRQARMDDMLVVVDQAQCVLENLSMSLKSLNARVGVVQRNTLLTEALMSAHTRKDAS